MIALKPSPLYVSSRMKIRRRESGMSYMELLIAAAIIAISVIPISEALQTSMKVAQADIDASAAHYRLVGRLETVLAEPFTTLSSQAVGPTTASSYSDAVATPGRVLVYIAEYDADDADLDGDVFTGGESTLLWVEVATEAGDQSLASLKTLE